MAHTQLEFWAVSIQPLLHGPAAHEPVWLCSMCSYDVTMMVTSCPTTNFGRSLAIGSTNSVPVSLQELSSARTPERYCTIWIGRGCWSTWDMASTGSRPWKITLGPRTMWNLDTIF